MKIKATIRFGVTAIVASMVFYSCTKDQDNQEEDAVFPETKTDFDSQVIEDQYIIVFNETIGDHINLKHPENYVKTQEAMQEQTIKILDDASISSAEILHVYSKTLGGATIKLSAEQVKRLRGKKEIRYIEQDRIVIFAPPCGTPKGGPCEDNPDDGDSDSSQQDIPYGITRVNGGIAYTGSNVAWIIDTGIDLDHPDLNVDGSNGFNAFSSGRDGKSLDDNNGHGTHVAGTIAALDNNEGVVGVAAGATVVPVKVLDSRGSGSYSGVIAGVDHVAANGSDGDVANMSLGGPVSQALDDAVIAASQYVKFSLAAGNSGESANDSSPARVNGANIVTISAMDSNDDWAYFSNFGNPPVDYAAPGVSVKSTWKNREYKTISGTSMAAPHAAGVLLLGSAREDGDVKNDPDGNPDPIIVH